VTRPIAGAPPPSPIPIKERASIVFVEKGQLDVREGAFVLVDATGVRTVIPVGGLAAIMLEPGTRTSHAAVSLAASAGTLLIWTGEAGVRLYAAGQPGGARSDKLLWQCRLALDPDARLRIVRKMFQLRFGEDAPERRSVDQLRGIEGVRVREIYKGLARQFGVEWRRRDYDSGKFDASDVANRACRRRHPVCMALRRRLSWRRDTRRPSASSTPANHCRLFTTSPICSNSRR
jgi:CRISP-associated protein Cas1